MRFRIHAIPLVLCLAAQASGVWGQGESSPRSFGQAAADLKKQVEASVQELGRLRQQIADETIPLSRQLGELEAEVAKTKGDGREASKKFDLSNLELSTLTSKNKATREEIGFVSTQLEDFLRQVEPSLHAAELKRYEKPLRAATLASDDAGLSKREACEAQIVGVGVCLDRLEDVLGGTKFAGVAADADGVLKEGTFIVVGPAALFRSDDGKASGSVELLLNASEPRAIPFKDDASSNAVEELMARGVGSFIVDPTLGQANRLLETESETFFEEVDKGGRVMIPIFALAGVGLLIALFKWAALSSLPRPSRKKIAALLEIVEQGDKETAVARAKDLRGPTGAMLQDGCRHLEEPRELVEEIMYERVLETRFRVQRFVPFIAICAAAAPLLGLLGTVTGIINTFKMITVVGSGDVKTLSGGISEALITTKFGLIVAIPALLLHAMLSRKARGIVAKMEAAAMSFLNRLPPSTAAASEASASSAGLPDRHSLKEQVDELLRELLAEDRHEELAGTLVALKQRAVQGAELGGRLRASAAGEARI